MKRVRKSIERKNKVVSGVKEKISRKKRKASVKKLRKQEEIRLLNTLAGLEPGSKQHRAIIDALSELMKSDDKVSRSELLTAGVSLVGLGGAVAYDSFHNVPSSARGWIPRPPKGEKKK